MRRYGLEGIYHYTQSVSQMKHLHYVVWSLSPQHIANSTCQRHSPNNAYQCTPSPTLTVSVPDYDFSSNEADQPRLSVQSFCSHT